MTNDSHAVTEIPSVRWDYLAAVFHIEWKTAGAIDALRAFEDMDTDWTYAERIDYLVTACLTSH